MSDPALFKLFHSLGFVGGRYWLQVGRTRFLGRAALLVLDAVDRNEHDCSDDADAEDDDHDQTTDSETGLVDGEESGTIETGWGIVLNT